MFLVLSSAYFLINSDVGDMVEKCGRVNEVRCGERCGKVCRGIREDVEVWGWVGSRLR